MKVALTDPSGEWVLLDELNLATQQVLEGLNALLDHRREVFVPEIGHAVRCAPGFRIFAAQNPASGGGGRKCLPRSFLNRFIRVGVGEFARADIVAIARGLFGQESRGERGISAELVDNVVDMLLDIKEERALPREWEWNLRDMLRLCELLYDQVPSSDPKESAELLCCSRLRSAKDVALVQSIIRRHLSKYNGCGAGITPGSLDCWPLAGKGASGGLWTSQPVPPLYPAFFVSATHLEVGRAEAAMKRGAVAECWLSRSPQLLRAQRTAVESIIYAVNQRWPVLLTGKPGSGKRSVLRWLAAVLGVRLTELPLNASTDATEILGSFAQVAAGHEFAWVDGCLVDAVKRGDWVVCTNADLCPPAVLDRLNSLTEPRGFLVIPESGDSSRISPHESFRIFFTLRTPGSSSTSLSAALRNRCFEVDVPLPGSSLAAPVDGAATPTGVSAYQRGWFDLPAPDWPAEFAGRVGALLARAAQFTVVMMSHSPIIEERGEMPEELRLVSGLSSSVRLAHVA